MSRRGVRPHQGEQAREPSNASALVVPDVGRFELREGVSGRCGRWDRERSGTYPLLQRLASVVVDLEREEDCESELSSWTLRWKPRGLNAHSCALNPCNERIHQPEPIKQREQRATHGRENDDVGLDLFAGRNDDTVLLDLVDRSLDERDVGLVESEVVARIEDPTLRSGVSLGREPSRRREVPWLRRQSRAFCRGNISPCDAGGGRKDAQVIPVLLRRRLLDAARHKRNELSIVPQSSRSKPSTHYFSVSRIAAFLIPAPRVMSLTRKLASKAKKRTVLWTQRHPGTFLSILRPFVRSRATGRKS